MKSTSDRFHASVKLAAAFLLLSSAAAACGDAEGNTAAGGGGRGGGGGGVGGGGSGPPLPVNLAAAGDFAILAKTGISTVPTSAVTGNLGISPAAATFITGFSLTADATNVFSTSTQLTGKAYAADYTAPTPSNLTTAVSDMQIAFTDAAGRAPDVTELGAGNIGGMTLAPGVYKWGTGLLDPDRRHAQRRRDRRLDLPDRPGPHHRAAARRSSSRAGPCPRTSSGRSPASSISARPLTSRASF